MPLNRTTSQTPTSGDSSLRQLRPLPRLAILLAGAVALAGCDGGSGSPVASADPGKSEQAHADKGDEHGHAEGDGHDHAHGKSESKETSHDDHGHDHAGAGHADEVKLTPEAIRAGGIRIAKAVAQKLSDTMTAPARVAFNSEHMAHVGSVLTGRVAELKVRVGDEVKKGDVLAVIDSTELGEAQSEYVQRRTAVATARPAVEIAKNAHERAKQLHEKSQGIALAEVQKRQGEYQSAEGQLASATAAVTAAYNRLLLLGMSEQDIQAFEKSGKIEPKYLIRAPIDGRVVDREVTLGELVGPGTDQLLVLADLRSVWVVADVPETKLGQIAVGAAVNLSVAALPSETFAGKVAYVAPQLDSETRTARVRVEVANTDSKLLPGMFAMAEINIGGEYAGTEVVAVPDDAVQTVEGEPAVFVPVEGEPNTFAKRAVGVGKPIGGLVPVSAGLKPGERYVASGSFLLKAELGKAGAAHEH